MDHCDRMKHSSLTARGRTVIADGQWADVSFPGFFRIIESLKS